MNTYVIMLKIDPEYQLLRRLVSDYPLLQNGFTLKEILTFPFLSWVERKSLKKMFGASYSEIIAPEIGFYYQNGKWKAEERDAQRIFHQFITKVLNHAMKEGKYKIGYPVSTEDINLAEFLIKKHHEVFEREIGEFIGYPDRRELLEFISTRLQEKLGKGSYFDYRFIKVFLESLREYDEMVVRREFGN